jgi:hypothetical protein
VFKYYWRCWYRKFRRGFGALAIWESTFDVSTIGRDLKNLSVVSRAYLRDCCCLQQSHIKGPETTPVRVDSNVSKILPTPACSTTISTPVLSLVPSRTPPAPSILKTKASTPLILKTEASKPLILKTDFEASEVTVPPVILPNFTKPPDETCHRRAFSSSVIRVPYLTFDRVVDHVLVTEGKVFKRLPPNQRVSDPRLKSRKNFLRSSATKKPKTPYIKFNDSLCVSFAFA